MIPRIQAAGGSFRGAGKYYLHDKSADQSLAKDQKPHTDERVWFTDTRNCMNTDPERALDEMWRTADDQAFLKMQAGVKRGGRACEDPVKTLSLAWHKDDRPTPEHMIEAADDFLKHMGWDQHQALYVGHDDTEHRHIHIIVNRVHPETGRTLDDYRERVRAQSWALAYEKDHEKIWCEQREINAAKREGRAVETERHQQPSPEQQPVPSSQRQPANDHLPHNVVMLVRPHEQTFNAQEKARELSDRQQRDHLKARQRAEREAYFKDGAKQFKAMRHAVYDEVRNEYAPDWKQFYKDADAAQYSVEAWSKSAVTRALYFSKDGRWSEARAAFDDRDSVRDSVARELSERKSDLKTRQTDDLRERQRDACDALRETRDVQYQELLQRQRDERAAANADRTLDGLGFSHEDKRSSNGIIGVDAPLPVNENRTTDTMQAPVASAAASTIAEQQAASPSLLSELVAPEMPSVISPAIDGPEATRQLSDLAAGSIGAAASYLADQLGEFFAPTPPEVREAQAKAEAKREAEKPAPTDRTAAYAKIIDAAVRSIEEERASGRDAAYWKERDRGKGWERDQ